MHRIRIDRNQTPILFVQHPHWKKRSCTQARVTLLHLLPNQSAARRREHRFLRKSILRTFARFAIGTACSSFAMKSSREPGAPAPISGSNIFGIQAVTRSFPISSPWAKVSTEDTHRFLQCLPKVRSLEPLHPAAE